MAEAVLWHDMGKEAAVVYVDFLVSCFEILYKLSLKQISTLTQMTMLPRKPTSKALSSKQTKSPSTSPTKEEKPSVSLSIVDFPFLEVEHWLEKGQGGQRCLCCCCCQRLLLQVKVLVTLSRGKVSVWFLILLKLQFFLSTSTNHCFTTVDTRMRTLIIHKSAIE